MTYRPSPVSAATAPATVAPRIVGVRRVADYLKRKLESDPNLRNVAVRGEITNFSAGRAGHANFDLKEGEAVLRCFAFASDVAAFPALANGLAVVATGSVTTYGPKSVYQLGVRAVVLDGVGDVHAEFEERKKRLSAQGVFAPERKRALPAFPFRVALVSSRSSDGAIDFVTLLRRRAPHVAVVWCETAVQGPTAPPEICAALRRASASDVDCIVVTRGGGSFEDLFAFSDESVVRAVVAAKHPVVSAIGHTADQQLCDFAADLHVETPSAAAKALGSDTSALLTRLDAAGARTLRAFERIFERRANRLAAALQRSKLIDPREFLRPLAQRVDAMDRDLDARLRARTAARATGLRELVRRLDAHNPTRRLGERALRVQRASGRLGAALDRAAGAARRRADAAGARLDRAGTVLIERRMRALELASARLEGNSPERLLQQGYAIVTSGGAIVRDAADVLDGALVEAQLARGTLRARVEREGTHGN